MFDPKDTLSRIASIRRILIRAHADLPAKVPELSTYQSYIDTLTALIGLMRGQSDIGKLISRLQDYQKHQNTIAHVELLKLLDEPARPVKVPGCKFEEGQTVKFTNALGKESQGRVIRVSQWYVDIMRLGTDGNTTGLPHRFELDGTCSVNDSCIEPL